MKKKFSGPLFIVGLSRSGTKLIRDILNRHPHVSLPLAESHFLPYVLKRTVDVQGVPTSYTKEMFKKFFVRCSFYQRMAIKSIRLDDRQLNDVLDGDTWQSVIESIFRFYGDISEKPETIWGDKSPRNLNHMPLLKRTFDTAKFIHIVRDPRDRACSVRHAWGGNIYLSSDDWYRSMEKGCMDAKSIGEDYFELQYEALVSNPERELKKICNSLHIDFVPEMLLLNVPVENLGNSDSTTRLSNRIISTNSGKYLEQLNLNELTRIEEIVFPLATKFGYLPNDLNTQHVPLGLFERLFWSVPHLCNSLLFFIRRWGIWHGIKYGIFRART